MRLTTDKEGNLHDEAEGVARVQNECIDPIFIKDENATKISKVEVSDITELVKIDDEDALCRLLQLQAKKAADPHEIDPDPHVYMEMPENRV